MKRIKCFAIFISLFFSALAGKDTTYVFQQAEIIHTDLKYIVDSIIVPFANKMSFDISRDLLEIRSRNNNKLEILFQGYNLDIMNQYTFKDYPQKFVYLSNEIPIVIDLPQSYFSPANKLYVYKHIKYSNLTDLLIGNDDESTWDFTIENNNLIFDKYFSFVHKKFDEWPLLPPDRRIKKLDLEAVVLQEIKSTVVHCPATSSPQIPLIPTRKQK